MSGTNLSEMADNLKTQLKERPIILNAQEVNAVLAADKTQHRVVFDFKFIENIDGIKQVAAESNMTVSELVTDCYNECVYDFKCPLGAIGDRLWVQEEHRPVNWSFDDGEVTIEYRDGTAKTPHYLTDEEFDNNPNDDYPFAVVDELLDRNIPLQAGKDCFDFSNPDNLPHWRSADVMPRFASRILLEVTGIRIECEQDLNIDEKSWNGNPWFWVVEFKKVGK